MKHMRSGILALVLGLLCLATAALARDREKPADPKAAAPPPAKSAAPAGCAMPDKFAAVGWPVRAPIVSAFGAQRNGNRNEGIDFAVPQGTPVKSIAAGIVIYAGEELVGMGKLALVRHAESWVSVYANNDVLSVKRGQTVCAGETIAYSGATGAVSQPQLHFELREGASPVDPLAHLPGPPPAGGPAPAAAAEPEPAAAAPPADCVRPSPETPPKAAGATSKAAPASPFAALVWPVRGRIVSAYGALAQDVPNAGIDIDIPEGTPVRSIADGTVVYADDNIEGYGDLILVRHADGFISAYGYNAELLVTRGQEVCAGQAIARSGTTGAAAEPRLHFELRKGATPVSPLDYLPDAAAAQSRRAP